MYSAKFVIVQQSKIIPPDIHSCNTFRQEIYSRDKYHTTEHKLHNSYTHRIHTAYVLLRHLRVAPHVSTTTPSIPATNGDVRQLQGSNGLCW